MIRQASSISARAQPRHRRRRPNVRASGRPARAARSRRDAGQPLEQGVEQPAALGGRAQRGAGRRIGDIVLAERRRARAGAAAAPRRARAGAARRAGALRRSAALGRRLGRRLRARRSASRGPRAASPPSRAPSPATRILDRAIPARLGRAVAVARRRARRRHRAAPRRGSARRRAAANAPRGRAGPAARPATRSGSASSSFLGRKTGTASRRPRAQRGDAGCRGPARSGSAQASARITTGDCRPLAPCTVITRTASSGAEGSRTISTSPRANQSRKACSEAAAVALELERAGQQFLDRVARLGAEPLEQLAAAVERAGQDGLEEEVRRRVIGHGEDRRAAPARRSAAARADAARAARSRPKAASNSSSWLQPNKGETSRLARLRSSSGWAAKRAAASRSCTASGAESSSRSTPATGTPSAWSRATSKAASSPRRRTRIKMSSGRSGRPRLSSVEGLGRARPSPAAPAGRRSGGRRR